jgi:ribosome-associated translation inhibitor RaiA
MNLRIHAQGFSLSVSLFDFVQQRLYYALGRYSGLIESVRVRLSDENGPRGGRDKRCNLQVNLRGMPPLLISEMSGDMYQAVALAVHRSDRLVGRTLQRRRSNWSSAIPLSRS